MNKNIIKSTDDCRFINVTNTAYYLLIKQFGRPTFIHKRFKFGF